MGNLSVLSKQIRRGSKVGAEGLIYLSYLRLEQIREERFLEMEKHNYRKMLERELREKIEYEDKLGVATKTQKQQLLETKQKRLKEIEEDILEGILVSLV